MMVGTEIRGMVVEMRGQNSDHAERRSCLLGSMFNITACKITDGRRFKLGDHPTRLARKTSKEELKALVKQDAERIGELQEKMYARQEKSLLLVFQAMDAAGKDSCISRVLEGISPQGCQVTGFKAPNAEERAHDFLWRHAKAAPAKGMVGVHNRSHYEEVLVVKVHPEFLLGQGLPGIRTVKDAGPSFWEARHESIRDLERHLARQGTTVLKFFLNMGREAQRKRLLERLEEKEKHWKFNPGDLKERGLWGAYRAAYEQAIQATAAPHAPWWVVPADRQWETRAIVCRAVREALEAMDLEWPVPDRETRKAMAAAKRALQGEAPGTATRSTLRA
jgi:PPK2 family polyphosphate:nucleotide phosphotransferase